VSKMKKYLKNSYWGILFVLLFLLTDMASAEWMKGTCTAVFPVDSVNGGSITAKARWIFNLEPGQTAGVFNLEPGQTSGDVLVANFSVVDGEGSSFSNITGTTANYTHTPGVGVALDRFSISYGNSSSGTDRWSAQTSYGPGQVANGSFLPGSLKFRLTRPNHATEEYNTNMAGCVIVRIDNPGLDFETRDPFNKYTNAWKE